MNEHSKLIKLALDARENSYSPYSQYKVGAALLSSSGKVYTGCNVESASYGATICAERTAFVKAVSEGERQFTAIAIAGGKAEQRIDNLSDYAFPCGICRQLLSELCDENMNVIIARNETDYKLFDLGQLLPHGFSGNSLK
ncbi:MAG TPA: cytidine deaminase [Oscillospiraceae bacterium]|nr:cytidine deaminase [Oscillospiraceae bacterium]